MKDSIFLLLLTLLFSCSTKNFSNYEKGELLFSQVNFKEKSLRTELRFYFDYITKDNKEFLVLKPIKKTPVEQRWTNIYRKDAIYDMRCKAWMGKKEFLGNSDSEYCKFQKESFIISHILLFGFIADIMIPFQRYETEVVKIKVPTNDIIELDQTETVWPEEHFIPKRFSLFFNNKNINSELQDGAYHILLKDLEFQKNEPISAYVHIDNDKTDISHLIHKEREEYKLNLEKKMASPEYKYNMPFCSSDRLIQSVFGAYAPPLENKCIYTLTIGQLKAFQSTSNGVLAMHPYEPTRQVILIKMKAPIADNDYLPDMLVKYSGIYQYTTITGATKSIHQFSRLDN